MDTQTPILLTAFEPSGDALAARLAQELKRRHPHLPLVGTGGEKMRAAGVDLLEVTTEKSVMGIPSLTDIREHLQRAKRIEAWLKKNPIQALVPTDSPAANWGICKMVRKRYPQARITHLAAPQLWAWGQHRVPKLRRLTDHVMCLLPFEPAFFAGHQIQATFVGHPLFEPGAQQITAGSPALPEPASAITPGEGGVRLALLPGSRGKELAGNWPAMAQAADELLSQRPGSVAVAAARTEADAQRLRAILADKSPLRHPPTIVYGRTDEVLAWANVALVTSGTATLQVAAHGTPMVAMYRIHPASWHLLGKWLVRTRTFTLPNLISEHLDLGQTIPELIPFFGDVEPLVRAATPLMRDGAERLAQQERFHRIRRCFEQRRFGQASADVLEQELARR